MASDNELTPPDPQPKTSRQVMMDMLKDTIGFDKGYYFTLRALYLKPEEVLNGYLSGTRKYLSPFALMGISLTIYYLISGLLVDWDAVSSGLKYGAKAYTTWLGEDSPSKPKDIAYEEFMVPYIDFFVLAASSYLIGVLPALLLFVSIFTFFTRHLGLRFYHHLVAFTYNYSFSILTFDLLILVSVINIWLLIPASLAMAIVFPRQSLRIYGAQKAAFSRPLIYSHIAFLATFALMGILIGIILSAWFLPPTK